MSASVTPINRWSLVLQCAVCDKPVPANARCDPNCVYDPDLVNRVWSFYGTSGKIEQFLDGAYYGTWHGGRTGAMDCLDECKAAVERACRINKETIQ